MATTELNSLPVEPLRARTRIRRGGPRTPLPLLPIIAIAAGVGIAYVSQTAQSTQATYRVTGLSAEQQRLRAQEQQLEDELARLQSSERIVAAAQQLGMRPAGRWASVAAHAVPVLPASPAPHVASTGGNDPLQQLVAALSGAAGTSGSSP